MTFTKLGFIRNFRKLVTWLSDDNNKYDFATEASCLFGLAEWIGLTNSSTWNHREYLLDCDRAIACATEAKS